MSSSTTTIAPQEAPTKRLSPKNESLWRRTWKAITASYFSYFCLILLILLVVLAIFAPWITPQNPYDLSAVSIRDSRLTPGSMMSSGITAWLGTDGAGRDLLSAILYGMRKSLFVGVFSGFIALMIGTLIGLVAAYVGGAVDALIMRIVDLQLSFPAILIALLLIAILGEGVDKVIIALVLVQWAYYARTARGTAMVERNKEYIEADVCLAIPQWRIVFRHLLPNCLPPLIVVATLQTAHAITLEATLSFLGVGLPRTEPSLGLLISNGFDYMMSGLYWISFFPGLALMLLIFLINVFGDRLREVLNPRFQR